MTLPATALGLLVTSSAGGAADAAAAAPSPEGASVIQSSIEAYLGKALFERGGLVIQPHADGYDFVLYPKKAFGQSSSDQAPEETLTFHVMPQDDDTFAFRSEAANSADANASADPKPFENCGAHGVFDAKARYFASVSAGCDHIAFKSQASDPFELSTGKLALELTGKPAANGTSDLRLALDATHITAAIPERSAPSPTKDRISFGRVHYDISWNALHYGALLDLYRFAFGLDTPSGDPPSEFALRIRLNTALPLWDTAQSALLVDDIHVEAPGGGISVGHYGDKHDLSGATPNGRYSATVELDEVSGKLGSNPKVLDTILPSKLGVRVALTGADLQQVAITLLRGSLEPKARVEFAMVDLLTGGKASLSANIDVMARDYAVTAKAQAPLDLNLPSTGTFSASGFDAIIGAVSNLRSDNVAGYALILAFLKGLAKGPPSGDLKWDVALDLLARQINVNGQVFNLR